MSVSRNLEEQEAVLHVFQYLAPVSIFVVYSLTSVIRIVISARRASTNDGSNQDGKKESTIKDDDSKTRARFIVLPITTAVILSYVAESILLMCTATTKQLITPDDAIISALYRTLIWCILSVGFSELKEGDATYTFATAWVTDLLFNAILFGLEFSTTSRLSHGERIFQITIQILRMLLVVSLLITIKTRAPKEKNFDEETTPLLREQTSEETSSTVSSYGGVHEANGVNGQPNQQSQQNGVAKSNNTAVADDDDEDDEEEDGPGGKNNRMKKHWWIYVKSFTIFLPYLWPTHNYWLQLHFVGIAACLLVTRLFNVLIPLQIGFIVNALADEQTGVPWKLIVIFIAMRLFTSSGEIDMVQELLWLPIERSSLQRLSCASYDHVMGLSSDFHTGKKSGRMWQTMHRGQSIVALVRAVAFDMLPMIVDLVVAIGVFYWMFDAYMAFIGATIAVLVLYSTQKTLAKKTEGQRKFIKLWEAAYDQMTESSLNWTTVSYFNRLKYESDRFRAAVEAEKTAWIIYRIIVYALNSLRSILLLIGLMAALLLGAAQIKLGNGQVGDFVALIAYWAQLGAPLSYLASGFSRIVENLIDSEKLLDLLRKEASVKDRPDAKNFILENGEVTFTDVKFTYDGHREVLKGIDFNAAPGKTVALVGESGGGKSTILKLLFRFYDVSEGSIKIDGQDLRDVTQESLRTHIGVVPQDAVLFNQTVLENLKYGNLEATDEQCMQACKDVALHDKIESFPKKYNTLVGERGVKMSGGELQRMAIARVLLKDPKIILLDEATSSVDSETEATIQSSLKRLTNGRTTFVIAHRLSTIVHADLVLVIKHGTIAERGTHKELIAAKGHYYQLWAHQVKLNMGDDQPQSKKNEAPPVFLDDLNIASDILPKEQPTNQSNGDDSKSKHTSNGHTSHEASHESSKLSKSPQKGNNIQANLNGGKKLKADAPVFVPQFMKSSNANPQLSEPVVGEDSQVSGPFELTISSSDAATRSYTDIGKGNGIKSNKSTRMNGTRKKSKKNKKGSAKESSGDDTSHRRDTMNPQDPNDWANEPSSAADQPKHKRNIFRRKTSKSEPARQLRSKHLDGTEDDFETYTSDETDQIISNSTTSHQDEADLKANDQLAKQRQTRRQKRNKKGIRANSDETAASGTIAPVSSPDEHQTDTTKQQANDK